MKKTLDDEFDELADHPLNQPPFDKPVYRTGLWLEVVTVDEEVEYIPAEFFRSIPDEAELAPHAEVDVSRDNPADPARLYTVVRGVGVRLVAQGADAWFVLGNEEEARQHITDLWGIDPDTGVPL